MSRMSPPTTAAKPAQMPTPRPQGAVGVEGAGAAGGVEAGGAVAGGTAGAAPVAADAPVVVRVENLGKRFRIYAKPLDRLREWLRLGGPGHTEFWALRGVGFEVRRGECLGVIGANGSGKSTLLKMVTGAMMPTEGSASVSGRVLSLIELGTGLNPHLTGRANIINSAALLGFPADYARSKMAEIEAFAELGEFFDRQIILYSSGMRVRLAFSMFACFRPELFIVDEALSVGDVFFQQKCTARLRELLDGGMTMLFVSHDQSAILNLCDRAILLEKGRVSYMGSPPEVVSRYSASLGQRPGPRRKHALAAGPASGGVTADSAEAERIIDGDVIRGGGGDRHGTGDMRIVAARVLNRDGRALMQAMVGEPLTIEVLLEAVREVHRPRAGMHLYDRFNNLVFAAGTYQQGHAVADLMPGDRAIVRLEVTMDVQAGEYTFGVGASVPSAESEEQGVVCDRVTGLGPLIVRQDRGAIRPFYGIARLPMKVSHRIVKGGA